MTDLTEEQNEDLVEHATRAIIGDRQEISEPEMKQVVWLIAEIMTDPLHPGDNLI